MSLIQKVLFLTTGLTAALSIQAQPQEPPEFFKVLPYKQVFKDMVLARCLAQVSTDDSAFSTDAGFSAYALMQWIPLDIETGNEKVNALILKYRNRQNGFSPEALAGRPIKGVTLNCLRLYHSQALEQLSKEVLIGDSSQSWMQDNPSW
ncbi:hypothetical protein SM092_003477 [Cronobacter sakazakii]|uniref:T6SS amidase immunity protein Tai4 family protein n=1 Tax=Cronobacter sakazakii TaxID=28141 RepID=UPI000CFDA968|nr:T6SS amidase immunity protein Tai4 family protein [Cronobacter sakazakii]EJK9928699.1 hypothetical protein [Cronobacter sakazakii]EKM7176503.1 hypothetical protein [Cronobacter sakazakii]ELY2510996.1 hypothetical protein [Cronobacter sakazakii]ELY2629488.1 hypothetical protein [Cronobacter sakazakii]ELY2638890.1 hypothetical protein [Cronobacter sakazakii]